MPHTPHLYIPRPWESDPLPLSQETLHHLRTVLRRSPTSEVSYTDGAGWVGVGAFTGGGVRRGEESNGRRSSGVRIVVAPPHRTERLRILVEKLVELGVESIGWLATRYGQGRKPKTEKCLAWAQAALEQSRGAWLPSIAPTVEWADVVKRPNIWIADAAAANPLPARIEAPVRLVIGPEGGFAPGEVPAAVPRFRLAETVLRSETAAIAAAVVALDRLQMGRGGGDDV